MTKLRRLIQKRDSVQPHRICGYLGAGVKVKAVVLGVIDSGHLDHIIDKLIEC